MSPEDTAPFLQAAAGGLSPGQAPAVQIGACRAIVHLCQRASGPTLQPHLPQIYQGTSCVLYYSCLCCACDCVSAVSLLGVKAAMHGPASDGGRSVRCTISVRECHLRFIAIFTQGSLASVQSCIRPPCLEHTQLCSRPAFTMYV